LFSYFDIFFLKSNVNIDSIKLINDFEISILKLNASKVNFLNFNSFEKTLKMQKMTQIHQKYIFFGLFAIFWIFFQK